jgi:hypothetical protein
MFQDLKHGSTEGVTGSITDSCQIMNLYGLDNLLDEGFCDTLNFSEEADRFLMSFLESGSHRACRVGWDS